MAVYHILDSHLVSEAEFARHDLSGQLALRAAKQTGALITLGSGVKLDFTAPVPPAPLYTVRDDGVTPFPPIGFGLPLTVDIRHVYSGRVGVRNIDGTGDIAVVSGVKDWSVFKASARALNFVAIHQGRHSSLTGPTALTDGTRVIAYQKAVVAQQVIVTVELTAAGKQDGILSHLGAAFTAAAGVPLFAPYAGALVAAGEVVPIIGKLADAITGGRSPWGQTAEINFGLPGTQPSSAEFRLIASAAADFSGYTFAAGRGLVDAQNAVYDGDEPYVVIAIYGGANPDLEGFTPAVAGADLIKRFYDVQTGVGGAIDDMVDLMKVASDVKFRDQALALKQQLAALPPASPAAVDLQTKLAAVEANIGDPALRP